MLRRCLPEGKINPDKVPYGWQHYGGRGIKVCRRWLKFEHYLERYGRET
jgi:hypothetical protein